jgi:hypothetical protein
LDGHSRLLCFSSECCTAVLIGCLRSLQRRLRELYSLLLFLVLSPRLQRLQ